MSYFILYLNTVTRVFSILKVFKIQNTFIHLLSSLNCKILATLATVDAVKRLMEPHIHHRLQQSLDTLKLPQFSRIKLDEYLKFMAPVATALDRLQGESQCYLGVLMPTVQQVQKKMIACSSTLNSVQSSGTSIGKSC